MDDPLVLWIVVTTLGGRPLAIKLDLSTDKGLGKGLAARRLGIP